MRRLIYTSKSRLGDNPAELNELVKRACALNEAAAITGMLWADEDRFVQVLEGNHEAVAATMKRISADPRHTDLEIVCDRVVGKRMFGTWAMIRSNDGPEGTESTAFLVGFVAGQHSSAARKAYNTLLKADGY